MIMAEPIMLFVVMDSPNSKAEISSMNIKLVPLNM